MMKTTRLLIAALGMVLLFGTGAFAEKTYFNGIDANYPPFAYVDKNGEPAGFDVDSLNWIAKKLGFKVVHKPMEWSTIVQSVLSKKIDMVYSGMSITKERAEKVAFSKPYWEVAQVFVAKKGSNLTVDKVLNDTVRLGVQSGTSQATYLKDNHPKKGWKFETRYYDSAPLIFNDLLNGRIQIGAVDSAPANDAIANGLPLQIIGKFGKSEYFGVAINKDNPELLALINKGIDMLKADPYWEELKAKHLKGNKH